MPIVVLDPGHQAAIDTGAQGNGLKEQNLTLAICIQLKPLLEYNGITTILTRDGDYVNGPHSTLDESLQTRVAISDRENADLFVSVHINAGGGTGTEVLIMGLGGRAEVAANKVLPHLVQAGEWANRGVRVQNIYVLKNTACPAILTESGFIDSASDSAKLKDPAFIHALAVAHAKGICDYFAITYKEKPPSPIVAPVATKKIIAPDDIYLSVRVQEHLAEQAIKDINKLGFACQRLDLA